MMHQVGLQDPFLTLCEPASGPSLSGARDSNFTDTSLERRRHTISACPPPPKPIKTEERRAKTFPTLGDDQHGIELPCDCCMGQTEFAANSAAEFNGQQVSFPHSSVSTCDAENPCDGPRTVAVAPDAIYGSPLTIPTNDFGAWIEKSLELGKLSTQDNDGSALATKALKEPIQFKGHSATSTHPVASVPSKRKIVQSSKGRPQKRRSGPEELPEKDDESDNDTERPAGIGEDSNAAFACPFFRSNPIRYRTCLNYKLTRIRDVKQHLRRRHMQAAFYCPICYEDFSYSDERDIHIRSRECKPCKPPEARQLRGMSKETKERLNKRENRALPKEEQWRELWKTLFTKEPSKIKPYLGTVMEESVGAFRDFWARKGMQIVPQYFANQGIELNGGQDPQVFIMGLFEEIQRLFEQETQDGQPPHTLHGDSNGRIDGNVSSEFANISSEIEPASSSYTGSEFISPGSDAGRLPTGVEGLDTGVSVAVAEMPEIDPTFYYPVDMFSAEAYDLGSPELFLGMPVTLS